MRINLLPPEIYERQRVRRRTAAVIVVGLIVLAAVGAFYFLQILRLNEVEDDIAAQEAENAQLQAQIGELQEIDALIMEIEATRGLLSSLLADRVLWSGVLRDISLVIPGQAWLNGVNGQVGVPGAEGTEPAQPGALVGQISFNGFAFTHRDVALWLSRLEDVRGFVNPWLSNSTKTDIGTQEAVQFTSSVDLSEQALARGRRGGGGGGQ
ncbi:MAG: PilN domain-containing protein [Actinomycetota bacterium]